MSYEHTIKYSKIFLEKTTMSENMNITTSIIVTCKNRLHHLQATLPRLISQSNSEVIVVDYGCEQGTGVWVSSNYPMARLISVTDDPVFCVSRARNIGAKHAIGKFLLFIDADVELMKDLGRWIHDNADEDFSYIEAGLMDPTLIGTIICSKKAFEQIGGYDEAFRGWSGEDRDLYHRLTIEGFQLRHFEKGSLRGIPHDDDERQLSQDKGGMGNRWDAFTSTRLYMNIKDDILMLAGVKIDLATRLEMMERVKTAIINFRTQEGEGPYSVVVNFEPYNYGGLNSSDFFAKQMVYTIKKQP
jgi:glycosyltransferase involved in cell wall biosynthesis